MGNCILNNNRRPPRIYPRTQVQRPIPIPDYNPPWDFVEDCVVCMDRKINTVLLTCGHCTLCYQCASRICETKYNVIDGVLHYPKCPICRSNIEAISLLYPKIIPVNVFNVAQNITLL